jgi:N6-adenosine-specific RNA methylase IME4
MSDSEIAAHLTEQKVAVHDDAVLFLWCTSSNIFRAGEIVKAWGFNYCSQAMWDKQKTGTGYYCLNQHEILLTATRGKVGTPQRILPSVFSLPRLEQSRKPPEIRQVIEEMYPDFDGVRVELFARGEVDGWDVLGYESALVHGAFNGCLPPPLMRHWLEQLLGRSTSFSS